MSQQTTTSSKQFSLNLSDWWKGLIMAVLTPVFAIIMNSINNGELTFNWKIIGGAAIAGMLAYLSKNFFDKPKIVITNPTEKQVTDVNAGEATAKVVPNK